MSDEQDRPRAAVAQRIGPMISVTIDSPNPDIGPHWDDLVRRAPSNVFMNPAALKAACDTDFAKIQMLLAWEEGAGQRRLVGLWALQLHKLAPFWPAVLEALPYNYAFLCSPVVDPAYADEVISALFAAIEENPSLPNVVSLQSLDAEGPNYLAILRELAARGVTPLVLSKSGRPFATRELGVKRSGSTRKKLRQDWNRLSALGAVDVVNDRTTEAAMQAFEVFLALEKASWKGAQGTALLSDPRDAVFVRRLFKNLVAQGNASVALLQVNGEAIAAQVLMYCEATAYTWKTAFNAEYSKYLPDRTLWRSIPALPRQVSWLSCGPGGEPWSICWSMSVPGNRLATAWKPAASSATSTCGTCGIGSATGLWRRCPKRRAWLCRNRRKKPILPG